MKKKAEEKANEKHMIEDIANEKRRLKIQRKKQEMQPYFLSGWPLNFPIHDGVSYHIPHRL